MKIMNVLTVCCLGVLLSPSAFALTPINATLFGSKAIKGYDAVAYFTESKPVKGVKQFSYEWKGATWLFSSAENLAAFMGSPEKYAPQYGGYCAWAVSQGSTADIDPAAWHIIGGRLYLNYDAEIQEKWMKDAVGNIQKGDQNWPKLLEK